MPVFDVPVDPTDPTGGGGTGGFSPYGVIGTGGGIGSYVNDYDFFPGDRLPGDPETYPKGTGITSHPGVGNSGGGGGNFPGAGGGGGFTPGAVSAQYASQLFDDPSMVGGFMQKKRLGMMQHFANGGQVGDPLVEAYLRHRMGGVPAQHFANGGQVDTVPAMLSPGEIVVNARAASHPTVAALLHMLNAMTTEEQGEIQHFADGGQVTGPPPGGGFAFMKWAKQNRDALRGGGQPAAWGAQTGAPGSVGGANQALGGFQQAGAFDPNGSPALMAAMQQQANKAAQGYQAQAMTGADVYGLDPSQAGAVRLQAMLGSQNKAADILGNAQYDQLSGAQDFGRGLYMNQLGFNQGVINRDLDYQHQRLLSNAQADQAKHRQFQSWWNPNQYVPGAGSGSGGGGNSWGGAGSMDNYTKSIGSWGL